MADSYSCNINTDPNAQEICTFVERGNTAPNTRQEM